MNPIITLQNCINALRSVRIPAEDSGTTGATIMGVARTLQSLCQEFANAVEQERKKEQEASSQEEPQPEEIPEQQEE